MTDPPLPPVPPPLGKRLMLLADYVHPFVYRAGFPQGVPEVDAVLAAGDLPGYYLEFLASKLTVPILYVHGNHENEYVNEGQGRIRPRGVVNVHRRVVQEAGLRVAGWGGAPRYRRDGQGQYSSAEARSGLRWLAWQARGGVDVLLTHAPPSGPHAGTDWAHRGCPEITRFMQRCHPRLLVHGHIHEYEGRKLEYLDEPSGCRVVNAYGYRIIDL